MRRPFYQVLASRPLEPADIKPVRPGALAKAISAVIEEARDIDEQGGRPKTESERGTLWLVIGDRLERRGFSVPLIIRALDFVWMAADMKPVPSEPARIWAVARAATAPINPDTGDFQSPADLFPA